MPSIRLTGTEAEVGSSVKDSAGKTIYVMMTPHPSNDIVLKLYDANAKEGDPFFDGKVISGQTTELFFFDRAIDFSTGLFATIEGQGGNAIIRYY